MGERIARLKREVEEVQSEIMSTDAVKEDVEGAEILSRRRRSERESIAKLSRILTSLQLPKIDLTDYTQNEDSTAMSTVQDQQQAEERSAKAPRSIPTSVQTHSDTSRVLSKATILESRLSLLEAALGVSSTLLPESSATTPRSNKPVLSHIATLEAQMSTLTSTTIPSLDSMRAQIDTLSTSTARLTEARSAAASAQAALLAAQTSRSPDFDAVLREARTATAAVDDPTLVAQVGSLYDALPTIEALAPLLPAVLERLRSLRAVHTDAVAASGNLAELEKTQAGMGAEIAKWREGLEKLEGALSSGGDVTNSNREVVEAWVRDLEARMDTMMELEES